MLIILTLFGLLFTNYSHADLISGKKGSLKISIESGYKLYKNFLGLPYIYILKEKSRKKSSVSITPTTISKLKLDDQLLQRQL